MKKLKKQQVYQNKTVPMMATITIESKIKLDLHVIEIFQNRTIYPFIGQFLKKCYHLRTDTYEKLPYYVSDKVIQNAHSRCNIHAKQTSLEKK